jgi:hypothetical protein
MARHGWATQGDSITVTWKGRSVEVTYYIDGDEPATGYTGGVHADTAPGLSADEEAELSGDDWEQLSELVRQQLEAP